MKKLLATSALALVGFASAASAQSVLERVLGEIDNSTNLASVNGTFANIAENIGGVTTVYYDAASNTTLTQAERDALEATLLAAPVKTDFAGTVATGAAIDNATGEVISSSEYGALSSADKLKYTVAGDGTHKVNGDGIAITAAEFASLPADRAAATAALTAFEPVSIGGVEGINGSITNVINGLDTATMVAAVGNVTATEFLLPTVDLGNISTTVLGAVNTGEITLGVNQSVDQAKTTSTGALSSIVDQIGGSADTGAIVLNIASNMTGVNGSISNTMTGVNGSVGNAATTVLGAVNTGTITSGVNAAVSGIVGGTSQTGGIAPVAN